MTTHSEREQTVRITCNRKISWGRVARELVVGADHERRALSADRHGVDERHHTMPLPIDHHLLLLAPGLLTTHHNYLTCVRLHGGTLGCPRWISTSANEADHHSKTEETTPTRQQRSFVLSLLFPDLFLFMLINGKGCYFPPQESSTSTASSHSIGGSALQRMAECHGEQLHLRQPTMCCEVRFRAL